MASAPVLDLNTVVGIFHVRIDGVPHFLSHPDALTLSQTVILEHIGPRLMQLFQQPVVTGAALSDADEKELAALLDRSVRIVLDAPDSVQAKLTDVQRAAIMNAFMGLRSTGQPTGATDTASQQTGAKSSQASKGSSAARRKDG